MKDFEKWNEEMFVYYGNQDRYSHENVFIRYNTLKRLNSILSVVHKINPGNVLEIGCGAGMILSKIRKYKSITGLDYSATAVKQAQVNLRKRRNIKIVKGDAQNFNLRKKFDTIICSEVLEHLPEPQKVIENIMKHAHPKTNIIITVPQEKNIDRIYAFIKLFGIRRLFGKKTVKMDWHIHKFSLPLIAKMLRPTCRIIRVTKTPFFFFPFSHTLWCKVKWSQ